jgi:hypothetical protein
MQAHMHHLRYTATIPAQYKCTGAAPRYIALYEDPTIFRSQKIKFAACLSNTGNAYHRIPSAISRQAAI